MYILFRVIKMIMRRSGVFYLVVYMALIGLIFRVFWLSIGENSIRAETVVNSRENSVTLYRTKGLIYDEQLNCLAGNQPCWYMMINPRDFERSNIETLVSLTKVKREEVQDKLKKETPFVLQTEREPSSMPGVHVFRGVSRYSGVASHLLGYLDSAGEVGLAGVEKEYNDYLNLFSAEVSVSYTTDAVRGAIAGLGITENDSEISDNGLVLTLNKELCSVLDQKMDEYIPTGAAVIMDCNTGAIKAVSSRPNYEESQIALYLESTGGELINRALSAQTVGSVFKIILAACALEAGMENFTYSCSGGILINDRVFFCHDHAGHGQVGLQEAFAQSCNTYFIALGQLLGYDRIAEMAKRFNYGKNIEVLGDIAAAGGVFPVKSSNLSLANLSIGQGELTASPLQIALMTAVVANGGILPQTHLYEGLYLNGKVKSDLKTAAEMRVLSREHADKLKQYCVYAVEEGTGKNAKPAKGSAGGKTSSAQTGIIRDGVEQLNVYFTGFYPAEDPQYVITIFAEDGEAGGETCGPVFREICAYLAS